MVNGELGACAIIHHRSLNIRYYGVKLLHRDLNVQVSDTTGVDSSTSVKYTIIL